MALACVLAGCGDPEMDVLLPGTKAVAFDPNPTPGQGPPLFSVLRSVDNLFGESAHLNHGDGVTVLDDPGFYDMNQAEIDFGVMVSKSDPDLRYLPKPKPRRFDPPDPEAKKRMVKVRVDAGDRAGETGWIRRVYLRPAQ